MKTLRGVSRSWTLLSAAVAALAALSLTLVAVLPGGASRAAPAPVGAADTVWPYYAQTTAAAAPVYDSPQVVTIRATGTAKVLATVRAPQPYQSIGFVIGAGQPDRWIVGAQAWHPVKEDNSAQPAKLYVLAFDPATRRTTLTATPVVPFLAGRFVDGVSTSRAQLAAATLSPDGKRLAIATTQGDTYLVGVYPVTGGGAGKTWTGHAPGKDIPYDWQFSLTWITGTETLAVGMPAPGKIALTSDSTVRYLDTAAPDGSLAAASKTVTLAFPDAKGKLGVPDTCDAPMVTSDGQRVLCPGLATYFENNAGATEVGVWVFSGRTGKLTAAWDKHVICCALTETMFPHVLWASPRGTLLIGAGLVQKNEGAQLYLRTAQGKLRHLPWSGLYTQPNDTYNIYEPSIAW